MVSHRLRGHLLGCISILRAGLDAGGSISGAGSGISWAGRGISCIWLDVSLAGLDIS